MFVPKHFAVEDQDEIFSFIEANAFGQIISSVSGRLFSSHLPFLLSADKTKLMGHFAKQNPQHRELAGQEVMITLEGPHDYISPTWYASNGVPTWNYQAVHIYGVCRVFTDQEKLRSIVEGLSNVHEAAIAKTAITEPSNKAPWKIDYKDEMLSAIVGVEMSITEIQCSYKLSQNRPAKDQKTVADELEKRGAHALSKAMRTHNT